MKQDMTLFTWYHARNYIEKWHAGVGWIGIQMPQTGESWFNHWRIYFTSSTYLYHIAQANPHGQRIFRPTELFSSSSGAVIIRKLRYRKRSLLESILSKGVLKASRLQSLQWNLYWVGSIVVCTWLCCAAKWHANEMDSNASYNRPSWKASTARLFNWTANLFMLSQK